MRLLDMGCSMRDRMGFMKRGVTDRAVRTAYLRLAARMTSRRADNRDNPRDDRAEQRQENDRRVHAVSPSSC
jgi:hypothetical protein